MIGNDKKVPGTINKLDKKNFPCIAKNFPTLYNRQATYY
jgi:hypothetical protein